MEDLPDYFVSRITKSHGQVGIDWLNDFAALRDDFRNRWSLTDPQPIAELSFNYLEYAKTPSGVDAVLKMGVPNPEIESEISTLITYAGRAAVKLLDGDPALGVLLLERIRPGHDLLSLKDDQAGARIGGQLMKNLWRPAPEDHSFPTIGKWCQGFARYQNYHPGQSGPLPADLGQPGCRNCPGAAK